MYLKSINGYRSTKKLAPHKSVIVYQKRHTSSNSGKKEKLIEYTKTTSIDYSKPVHKLVGRNYLKLVTNI